MDLLLLAELRKVRREAFISQVHATAAELGVVVVAAILWGWVGAVLAYALIWLYNIVLIRAYRRAERRAALKLAREFRAVSHYDILKDRVARQ